MKLTDYAGLPGKWPPPGRSLEVPLRSAPLGCIDVLLVANRFRAPLSKGWNISILTILGGERYVRRITLDADVIFATVFAEFLCRQRGKTIQQIGQMDVTFLG